MNFGIALFQTQPIREIVDLAKLAESFDFSHVWIGDSQMIWREASVTLGALAMATGRVKLGTAVTNPLTRHPAVTASAFSSLHELSGGRGVLGIGLGDSAVETLGIAPAKMQVLRESIALIRLLANGEDVDYCGHKIKLVHACAGMPIWVGATGPKMLELAGEIADGVIMMTGALPTLISHGLGRISAAAVKAGRDPAQIETAAWVPMSISSDNSKLAKDNVRAHVARWAMRKQPVDFEPGIARVITEIRKAYDYYGHLSPGSPQSKVVTDELVDLCTIAGTPDECLRKVRELEQCGVNQIALVTHGDGRAEQIKLFANEVLARI
jgi:5,10-methylenetetrahydromethanopterin reductase